MKDAILMQLMKWMPTHSLSRWIGRLAKKPFSRRVIPLFARFYDIPIEEAEHDLSDYASLTDFFTRRLKTGFRPIPGEKGTIVSPADGKIAAFGEITNGHLIQAKGVFYSVWDLLGISEQEAASYVGGNFLTVYLSPRDYHRVHSPVEGMITDYSYLPGTLFPVNAFGVRAVKGLFAKNERLATFVDSPAGKVGVVKVGATIVGSVRVRYSSEATTNVKAGTIVHQKLAKPMPIERGEEIGFFEFGSTVVLVFEKGKIEWIDSLRAGQSIKMGETIGKYKCQ
jgi:phosphatidylserine decarboxylase